ncbi:hypothetical protein CP356_09055 [Lactobacillus sp. UMNPBX5]|nr:hypothetical protein CP356_09055 [Lactobacillus sp. UMNPBX5]
MINSIKRIDWEKIASRTMIAIESAKIIIPNYPSDSVCTHVILVSCYVVVIASWFTKNKE